MITEKEEKSENESSKEEIIEHAKKRFKLAEEAWSEIRAEALEDYRFRSGDQWPTELKHQREMDKRPCLTINRLPQFIQQLTNDQRQNRPAIKVSPVDDLADPETAKVFQGLIRHIEYNSDADTAYDTAFDGAVTGGFGFFRIITDYVSPESFDQEILIKQIKNPFSVYLDPYSQEPDGSDAKWAFVFEDICKEDYEEAYGESKLSKMSDWRSLGDSAPGWFDEDSCRIADYYTTEYKTETIYLLSDKSVVKKSELPEILPEGIYVVNERKTQIPIVKIYKINGLEILEQTEWLCEWIPVLPNYGNEIIVDGNRILEGVVRHARDSQKMYNLMVSSEVEAIALTPKVPFIGAEGQFEGHERKWASANSKNHSYLEYKPVELNGSMAPPPQRQFGETAIQAITQSKLMSADDLKATTGIYDAALGNRSNENSGVAIQKRANQAQTANFHFMDNASRTKRHAGRILVNIIPKVYDVERAITIIGEDDEEKQIFINKIFEDKGEQKHYDLSKGKYDVTISQGPSYQTKRQEASEFMIQFTQAVPQAGQFMGDLIAKYQDWPGADKIAERLKKLLPPEMQEENKEVPPQVQAQMQQLSQMNEQLTQALNQAQDQLETKAQELEFKRQIEEAKLNMQAAKMQADMQMQLAKIEADMRKELLKQDAADSRFAFNQEINQLDKKQKMNEVRLSQDTASQTINPTGGPSPGNSME